MHYLFYTAIEAARNYRMSDAERQEQIVSFVYGNIHMEQPAVTKELVRELVQQRYREKISAAAADLDE